MTMQALDRKQLSGDDTLYDETRPDPALRYLRFATVDNVVLSALLFSPAPPTDRVLLLVPGLNGGILGGHHDYRPLARKLASEGVALMLLNMRCSNTFAHSKFEDSRFDIQAAVSWLKGAGFGRIALFGTSLGGPRVMFFNHMIGDPAICMMGFIASIRSPYMTMSDGPYKDRLPELDKVLERARESVAQGRGSQDSITFDHFLPGRPQTLSAVSFLSYFGTPDDTQLSTIGFGASVRVPTLVIGGTADEVANISNSQDIYESLVNAPRRDLLIVEGANHYLTAGWISRAYATAIGTWVADAFSRAAVAKSA